MCRRIEGFPNNARIEHRTGGTSQFYLWPESGEWINDNFENNQDGYGNVPTKAVGLLEMVLIATLMGSLRPKYSPAKIPSQNQWLS